MWWYVNLDGKNPFTVYMGVCACVFNQTSLFTLQT